MLIKTAKEVYRHSLFRNYLAYLIEMQFLSHDKRCGSCDFKWAAHYLHHRHNSSQYPRGASICSSGVFFVCFAIHTLHNTTASPASSLVNYSKKGPRGNWPSTSCTFLFRRNSVVMKNTVQFKADSRWNTIISIALHFVRISWLYVSRCQYIFKMQWHEQTKKKQNCSTCSSNWCSVNKNKCQNLHNWDIDLNNYISQLNLWNFPIWPSFPS